MNLQQQEQIYEMVTRLRANSKAKLKQDKEFQSTLEVSEQSKISENQKKLMKSRSERYKDAQKILENSIRLNSKLILNTSQD